MNIQKKVEKYINCFERKERDNGEVFYFIPEEKRADVPELHEAVRKSHESKLPDDYTYQWFLECLEQIRDYNCEDIDSIHDDRAEMIDGLVSVYTYDLLKWLSDDVSNVYYITQVLEEQGAKDGFQLLSMAQYYAIDEIMGYVIELLEDQQQEDENV